MASRITVLTGASSGLGLALSHALAAQGDRLFMLARSVEKLQDAALAVQVGSGSATVHAVAVDVTRMADLNGAFDAIAGEFGGIDLLINCAAVMREGYFESLQDEDYRAVLDTNFFGAVNCVRAALPHLRKSQGQIVNIASMASHTGVFGYSAYCASKHALKGFTEALYHELTPQGITVQLICPPEFDSPMTQALAAGRTPENATHTLMIPRESIDIVVRDTLRAISSRRYHTITGWRARLAGKVIQHLPNVSRAVAQRAIRKTLRTK